jgi:uncharacterized protein (TIRG00374 family)
MPRFKKVLQPLLFFLGLCLFFAMIRSVGIDRLRALGFLLTGPAFGVFFIYLLVCSPDVLAWQVLFSEKLCSKVRFRDLYGIRLAGEALNNTTPFIDIGGEFLKVFMVAGRYGLSKKSALTVTVMDRTTLFISEIAFWIVGLVLAVLVMPIPPLWTRILLGTTLVSLLLGSWLLFIQRQGFFLTGFRMLQKLGLRSDFLEKFQVSFQEVDEGIASFYREERLRTLCSYFLHFLGWMAGGLEIYFMFRVVGISATPAEAVLVEALLQMIRTSSSFIPGNLGAQEAGMALAAGWLGFHPSVGVTLSLLKRFRQLIWISAGFAIWGVHQWTERRRKI